MSDHVFLPPSGTGLWYSVGGVLTGASVTPTGDVQARALVEAGLPLIVTGLQGYGIANAQPSAGQLLAYLQGQWRPYTLALVYQTVRAVGTDVPKEAALNFLPPFTVADNPGNGSTDVGITLPTPSYQLVQAAGVSRPPEVALNFGVGFTVTDNPRNGSSDVSVSAYQTIEAEGTAVPQANTLNFLTPFTATSDPENGRTNIGFDLPLWYMLVESAGAPVNPELSLNFLAPFTVTDDIEHGSTNIGLPLYYQKVQSRGAITATPRPTLNFLTGFTVIDDVANNSTAIGITFPPSYQTIASVGSPSAQKKTLNFLAPFTVTDNPSSGSTDVGITLPSLSYQAVYAASTPTTRRPALSFLPPFTVTDTPNSTNIGITLPATYYQAVQGAGATQPQENKLNFVAPFVVTDNPRDGSTDISFNLTAANVPYYPSTPGNWPSLIASISAALDGFASGRVAGPLLGQGVNDYAVADRGTYAALGATETRLGNGTDWPVHGSTCGLTTSDGAPHAIIHYPPPKNSTHRFNISVVGRDSSNNGDEFSADYSFHLSTVNAAISPTTPPALNPITFGAGSTWSVSISYVNGVLIVAVTGAQGSTVDWTAVIQDAMRL
jgi:hypothetical protein